jgi:hypothetical protein
MKKAQIYKISNTKTVDIYIGSTIQKLKDRFKAHRSNAKLNKNGKLYDCMRENGIEFFNIELLEEFDYNIKQDIGIKEKEYYEKLKPTLNMICPTIAIVVKYGRIYKLFNKLKVQDFYIGSTIKKINKRLCDHKSASNNGSTPIYKYMREVGKDNFEIELIEDNILITDLIVRENHWIQELKPILNKNLFLCRTEQERDAAKYQKNKEKVNKRVNLRRIIKRDEINAQKREHYRKNKEQILAKQSTQEYRDNANKLRRERLARKKVETEKTD